MLNDKAISDLSKYEKLISPFDTKLVQPHSYDLTLHPYLQRQNANGEWYSEPINNETFIFPKEFLLASTLEVFSMPQNLVGFVQGKSTIGRMGLQIENAGLIDAGFSGQITLELYNMSRGAIRLRPGQRICQVYFVSVDKPLQTDYAKTGHYNGQMGPTLPFKS